MIWLILLAQEPADMPVAELLARSHTAIAGEACRFDSNATDITVCGRRRADRFRVPLIAHDAGDPRHEAVAVERDRLLNRTNPTSDLTPFLVGGGMAGATISSRHGLSSYTARTLAP